MILIVLSLGILSIIFSIVELKYPGDIDSKKKPFFALQLFFIILFKGINILVNSAKVNMYIEIQSNVTPIINFFLIVNLIILFIKLFINNDGLYKVFLIINMIVALIITAFVYIDVDINRNAESKHNYDYIRNTYPKNFYQDSGPLKIDK